VNNKRKRILIITLTVFLVAAAAFSSLVAYAWFTNIPRVFTSDNNPGEIATIGMRINLLFERLRPEGFAHGSTITYADGRTAVYDETAEWGNDEYPFIGCIGGAQTSGTTAAPTARPVYPR